MSTSPDQDFVLKTIKKPRRAFRSFWFCDVLGHMKSLRLFPVNWKTLSKREWALTAAAFAVLPLRVNRICSHILKLPISDLALAS